MECNFIIVGGGSAGCVLADRLSADPNNRVILVEAGGEGKGFLLTMPAGYGVTANAPSNSWHYKSEPEPSIGGRQMLLPRGLGLGGSSNINGLLYVRGQHADFDGWSQLARLAGAGPMSRPISARARPMPAAAMRCAAIAGHCGSRK